MNNDDDILARLDSAKKLITKLSLEDVQVSNIQERSDPTDVASILEHLKAVLDYLMLHILIHHEIKSKKTHFPLYCEMPYKFKRFMKRNHTEIPQNSELYNKLEKIQYYNDKPNRGWMKELAMLANPSKHSSLPKTIDTIKPMLKITSNDDRVNILTEALEMSKSGQIITSDGIIQCPINVTVNSIDEHPHPLIKKIYHVNRKFEDTNTSILSSLSKMHKGVCEMVDYLK